MFSNDHLSYVTTIGKRIFYGGLSVIVLLLLGGFLTELVGFHPDGGWVAAPLTFAVIGAVGLILLYVLLTPFYVLYKQIFSEKVELSKAKLIALFTPLIAVILIVVFQLLQTGSLLGGSACSVTTYEEFISYYERTNLISGWTDAIKPYYLTALSIFVGGSFFTSIFYYYRRNDNFSALWLGLWIFTFLLFTPILFASITRASWSFTKDDTRGTHLSQVRTTLDMYKEDNGQYPVVTEGTSSASRWSELKSHLENYMKIVPDDECSDENPKHQYDYKSDSNGSTYVLKALFTDLDDLELPEDDIDGEVLGVDCGKKGREQEFIYCIGPDNSADQSAEKDE